MPRIQFRISDIDLEELQRLEAEVAPSHTQILRDALREQWLRQIDNFPQPMEVVTADGVRRKNRAAIEFDSAKKQLDLVVDYEHQLSHCQTVQIRKQFLVRQLLSHSILITETRRWLHQT